jgi:hypothetical protein
MSRIFSFLIIVGGLVGCYFLYQDYAAKTKEKRNTASEEIARLIDIQCRQEVTTEAEDASFVSQGNLFRIMAYLRHAEENNYSVADTLRKAVEATSARPGEGRMIAEMLSENYRVLKQLDVFYELGNLLKMERGRPPVAKAAEWEDEEVVVGYVLSPLHAPEASYSLVNLLLLPESVRNMQTDALVNFGPEIAKKWLVERIISPDSHQLILDQLMDKTKINY